MSQCMPSVYKAGSSLQNIRLLLLLDLWRITIMNVVIGNTWRLLPSSLPARLRQSIADDLVLCLPFFLDNQIMPKYVDKTITIQCCEINSELSKVAIGSMFSNDTKHAETNVIMWRGPSRICYGMFCLQILPYCFFSTNQATYTFFHLLNTL